MSEKYLVITKEQVRGMIADILTELDLGYFIVDYRELTFTGLKKGSYYER